MTTVMPTATYPKTYCINEKHYVVNNLAEDTAFKASPMYCAKCVASTYPKVLTLGDVTVRVNSAAEETAARTKFAQG